MPISGSGSPPSKKASRHRVRPTQPTRHCCSPSCRSARRSRRRDRLRRNTMRSRRSPRGGATVAADGGPAPGSRRGIASRAIAARRAARPGPVMRGLLALIVIAAVVAAAGFLAGHPGHVEIVWQGWQIDTSAAVLMAIFIAAVLLLWGLIALAGGLLSAPRHWRRRRAVRRRRAGEAAVTRGLVALAAGNAVRAQREAARATQLLRGAPVPLLLAAEAAQQQGDRGMARQSFARLLERPETELLGLRGLLAEALKSGDHTIARRFAERARQLQPASPWLAENVLALQARAADWPAARDA